MKLSLLLLSFTSSAHAWTGHHTKLNVQRFQTSSSLKMNVEKIETKENVRVGVIGMGRIGLVHLEAISKAPGVTPVIISNPTISKAEVRCGFASDTCSCGC